jgi:Na+/melibiose symporter-like transporter
MDLLAAMLILYFTYCLGRSEDFELGMLASLTAALVALPLWLQLARRLDKDTVFILGALLWMAIQIALSLATPEWPSAALLGLMCVAGAGFAAVDLMPWAMLGEVIDEDDLATGERREGLYNGLFLFLRKLAGAAAVLLALGLLDLAGFVQGEEQPEAVRRIILLLTTLVPAACLALGIWFARGYPLTRDRHLEIIDQLRRRAAGRRVE